jgi:hypothetical protein
MRRMFSGMRYHNSISYCSFISATEYCWLSRNSPERGNGLLLDITLRDDTPPGRRVFPGVAAAKFCRRRYAHELQRGMQRPSEG